MLNKRLYIKQTLSNSYFSCKNYIDMYFASSALPYHSGHSKSIFYFLGSGRLAKKMTKYDGIVWRVLSLQQKVVFIPIQIDLEVRITPFYLLFEVVGHPDKNCCLENMQITARYLKFALINVIEDSSIFIRKFATFWCLTTG